MAGVVRFGRDTRRFWDLERDERLLARDEGLVDGDEFFVLYQINRGRRFVRDLTVEGEETDPVELAPPPVVDEDGCELYDAVAALLFAGASQGHSPEYLVRQALAQYDSFMERGRTHALNRETPTTVVTGQRHVRQAPSDPKSPRLAHLIQWHSRRDTL